MNTMRKIFGIVAAIGFAMLAMPATAQNVKYFELKQTVPNPANAMPVTTTNITVTFKNLDNGNSSFNSVGIKGTMSGGGTVTILSAVSSPGAAGQPLNLGDGYFYLTNAGPFKKGQTMTVAMTVSITGATGCANQSIAWHGRAFTGSPSQPATEFQQANADPVVNVTMGCNYSYTITDKIYKGDKDKTISATVSNPTGSPQTISSVGLKAPAGIIRKDVLDPINVDYAVSIAAGSSSAIDMLASAPCDNAGVGGAWTSSVTGFELSGGEKSTAVKGNCTLAFVAPPKSIVPGEEFPVTIKLYNDDSGSTITTFTGKVTVVVDGSGCSVVGDPGLDAVDGIAALSVTLNADATATTCSIKAKTTIGTTDFYSSKLTLTVFDGTLSCATDIPDALELPTTGTGSFDESTGGATAPGMTGFVAGVRGRGGKDPCGVDINYAVYNNIPTPDSGPNMTDPLGNSVPPGFYSFTWDVNQVEKPIIAVIATYQPEWGDAATGLPTHKTLICTVMPTLTVSGWVGCTSAPYTLTGGINTAGGWKAAPACLSTLVTHASLPAGEIGCVAAERWDVVPALIPDPNDTNVLPAMIANPNFCEGSPPLGAVPSGGRCLKPTAIMIMGKDPVFGR
jgi:hypothetical protein